MNMNEKYSEIFAGFEGVKQEVIPLLQAVQEEFGFIPDDGMEVFYSDLKNVLLDLQDRQIERKQERLVSYQLYLTLIY